MDKETLSNYGWIVICVLVLAVMIALATPFGTFVSGAVKSTTQGLFDVNQNALNSTGLINIGDQSFGEGGNGGNGGAGGSGDAGDQGSTGEQGGNGGLPSVGTSAEDCTWDEIKAISEAGKGDEYFNLGDTKTFTTTDNKTIVMEIVAFNADTKADGTGTAGITWISKDIVATHAIKSAGNNAGGWKDSDMRNWLQNDFYSTLGSDVQKIITPVNKTYYYYINNSNSGTVESCTDSVWIPSVREIYGTDIFENTGAIYTSHFIDNASRVKDNGKDVSMWWLRSTSNRTFFTSCYVYSNGSGPNTAGSQEAYGVVLGFCT